MEVEQERPAERSNIAGAPQVGRKSVNWARKREVLEDENLSVFAMGSIESSSSNITAPGREGAISPLDFAAATAVATGFHRPQSSGGAGAGGAESGRMYGKSSSRAASRGVSRTNSAVSGLRQGGLPAAGGGYGGPGGYGNAGGVSAVPSSAWGGGTEGGESTYSTVFERPPVIPRRPSARSLATAGGGGGGGPAHLNVNVGPFPAGAPGPVSGSPVRPGTSAGYDTHGGQPPGSPSRPITPASPSKVGLSARQRAMMDAAAVGQFRFARIPRPSGAGGGAALPSVYSSVPGGAVNVLNLEGGGGGGGGEPGRLGSPGLPGLSGREGQAGVGAGLNAFRVSAAAVMAAAAFSASPIAPYRRAAPPQPAANFGPSGAGGGSQRPSDAARQQQQQQQMLAARPSTMAMATSIMAELNAAHMAAHEGMPLGGGGGGLAGTSASDGGAAASSLSVGLPPPPPSGAAAAAAIAAAATPSWAHPSAAANRGDLTSRSAASLGERKAAAAAAANASAVTLPGGGGSSDVLLHAASIYQSHGATHGHGHEAGPGPGPGPGGSSSSPAVRTEVLASFVRPGRGAILQPGLVQPPPPAPDISDAEALLLGSAAGGLGHLPGAEAFDPAAASSAMLDAELAPLLKEVAEINVRPAVRAALGKLDDRAIKQL